MVKVTAKLGFFRLENNKIEVQLTLLHGLYSAVERYVFTERIKVVHFWVCIFEIFVKYFLLNFLKAFVNH